MHYREPATGRRMANKALSWHWRLCTILILTVVVQLHSYVLSLAQDAEKIEYRRNFVRTMMKHAWKGYANYAWGHNEVRPVSRRPNSQTVFGNTKLGATIVDGIDTLFLMNLTGEYQAARNWIENDLDFNVDIKVSVFETNIRFVGGLLSIYALTKDRMFLNKAIKVANKLLPAFDTQSGIPYQDVNLLTGHAQNRNDPGAILSEFGSMHLEFIYLSHATGDPRFRRKVMKIRETMAKATPRPDGLYNNYMDFKTGQWLSWPVHVSIGSLGDSFYEYLIKSYVQSDRRDWKARQMYYDAIEAMEDKLLFTTPKSNLIYLGQMVDSHIKAGMDTLACFAGGMLAIGADYSSEEMQSHHMTLAQGITNTCHESCIRTKSHLGPEAFMFYREFEFGATTNYYSLRPEIVESYFYMWRYTHDPKYREWAWDFVEALERHCKTDGGYSGLSNVHQPGALTDQQDSFFLAEVLKYLYLIFSDDDVIDLRKWVFNTEAHPLPILNSNDQKILLM